MRELTIGHTVPREAEVASVTLDGETCRLQGP